MNITPDRCDSCRRLARFAVVMIACLHCSAFAYFFELDRSVMSDKYWEAWNDKVQSKIDADIEKYRKVLFRGFRGKYRLSWKDKDGKACEKTVEVD